MQVQKENSIANEEVTAQLVRTSSQGVVKRFDGTFGFIKDDDKDTHRDVFVHHRHIEPEKVGFKKLVPGERVTYDLMRTDKGLQAFNVRINLDMPAVVN